MKVKSKLIDAQLEDRGSAPTKGGEILINTAASNQVQYHDSSSARTVVNTDQAQTLTNKTLTSPVLNTGVSGSAVLDEDDMASDSATQLATQQSIKAYADSVASTASTNLTNHINDTTTHGVAGAIVGTSDTQTLTNKTIDADNNTISNLAHGAEVDNPSSGVHGVSGSVVGTSDAQTLTNKTFGDAAILTEITTPTNPSAGTKKIYAKTDGKLYQLDSSGVEQELGAGSGGGGINFFDPASASISGSVADWETDDGAGNAATGLTLSVTTTVGEVIDDEGSLKIVKAAADHEGEFVKLGSETISPAYQGKQAFGRIAVRPGTGYVSGDFRIQVWDLTNDAELYAGASEDLEILNFDGIQFVNFYAYLEDDTAEIEFRLVVNNTNTNGFDFFADLLSTGPASVLPATFERYEVIDLTGSGDFTAGVVAIGRTGNQVSGLVLETLTFSSNSQPESAAGKAPSWARPAVTAINVGRPTNSATNSPYVEADGTFGVELRNWSGTLTATTALGTGSTFSYTVPSTPFTMTTNELGLQKARVSLKRTSTQSIPDSTYTAVAFNSVIKDKFNLYDGSSKIIIPRSGELLMTFNGIFATNATGVREVTVYKNGTELSDSRIRYYAVAGDFYVQSSLEIDELEKDDEIEVFVRQTSGGSLNLLSAKASFTFIENLTLIGAVRNDEYLEDSLPLTDSSIPAANVWGDAASITLSAGTWDLTGIGLGRFLTSGAGQISVGISETSGNVSPGSLTGIERFDYGMGTPSTNTTSGGPCSKKNVTVTTPTTFYFKWLRTSTAVSQWSGLLEARRIK